MAAINAKVGFEPPLQLVSMADFQVGLGRGERERDFCAGSMGSVFENGAKQGRPPR